MFEALGPDIKWEPLFKTDKEYQEFRERWLAAVEPDFEKYRIAHVNSIRESMNHFIGG